MPDRRGMRLAKPCQLRGNASDEYGSKSIFEIINVIYTINAVTPEPITKKKKKNATRAYTGLWICKEADAGANKFRQVRIMETKRLKIYNEHEFNELKLIQF